MLATDSAWSGEELGKYQPSAPCEVCNGARLKPEALAVKVAGETIADAVRRPVDQAYQWALALADKLTDQQRQIAERILKEIIERVGFLNNVGLEYLNLDRTSGTRSEEHTSELQSLMRISYAVFCLKKTKKQNA